MVKDWIIFIYNNPNMGLRSYKRRLWKKGTQMYKKLDIYAKDLTLTFEGEDKHATYIGATFTTLIMGFMMVYAIFQLEVLFKRERTTVNLKTTYQDLTKFYDNYTLEDYGFDFALNLEKFGTPIYDESYFYYEVENVNSWWAPDSSGVVKRYKTSTDLKMSKCKSYNASAEDIERLGIYQNFYCPELKEYSIGGTFVAPNYRYLYIKLLK